MASSFDLAQGRLRSGTLKQDFETDSLPNIHSTFAGSVYTVLSNALVVAGVVGGEVFAGPEELGGPWLWRGGPEWVSGWQA